MVILANFSGENIAKRKISLVNISDKCKLWTTGSCVYTAFPAGAILCKLSPAGNRGRFPGEITASCVFGSSDRNMLLKLVISVYFNFSISNNHDMHVHSDL